MPAISSDGKRVRTSCRRPFRVSRKAPGTNNSQSPFVTSSNRHYRSYQPRSGFTVYPNKSSPIQAVTEDSPLGAPHHTPAASRTVAVVEVGDKAPTVRNGTHSGWAGMLAIFLTDLAIVVAAGFAGVAVMSLLQVTPSSIVYVYCVWAVTVLAFFHFAGLNRVMAVAPASELRWVVLIVGGTALAFTAAQQTIGAVPAKQLVFLPLAALVLCIVWPVTRQYARRAFAKRPWWGVRVLVIGGDDFGVTIFERLLMHPEWGLRPVGVLEELDDLDLSIAPEFYQGPPGKLAEAASRLGVSTVIVVPRDTNPLPITDLVRSAEPWITSWLIVPSLRNVPAMWNDVYDLQGQAAIGWRNRLASPPHRMVKRTFDLTLVLLTLPVTLPLIGLLALLIRLTSKGPAFFVQRRLGYGGATFPVFKFRTMHLNAEDILEDFLKARPELREEWKRNFKLRNDPRVTWIGRYLRRTSLDELPQLFNVLLGQMSLVGPRPLLESETLEYGDAYTSYVQTVPGLTGMWQISGRSNTTFAERAWFDEYYVRNWSPWLDLYILGSTVNVVLRCDGAY